MSQAVLAPAPVSPLWYRVLRVGLSLSPLVAVHLALFAAPFLSFSWLSVLLIVLVTRFSGFGVTVGLHRYFAHRSFKTSRWFQFLLAAAGCTALQKGPLWWVVHHRLHHQKSDEPGDPHSPVVDGFWYGHVGWLFARDLMHPDHDTVRDLTKYPELVWLDSLWMIPGVLLAGLCYLIDGWSGVVFGFCLSVVFIFQVTFAINSVGHLWGRQRFDTGEGSRNNFVLGILAMGEGWHNNHHRAPSSASHGFAWYELDMSFRFICALRKLGVVWDVIGPPLSVRNAMAARSAAAAPEGDG